MSVQYELESLFDQIVEVMNRNKKQEISDHSGRILLVEIVDANFRYAIMATSNGAMSVDPERVIPTGTASMHFDTFSLLLNGKMSPRDALTYQYVVFVSENPIADYIMVTSFLESLSGEIKSR